MVFVVIGGVVAGLITIGTVTDSLTRRHRREQSKGMAWADPNGQARWQANASGDAAAAAQTAPPPMIGGGGGSFS